MTREEAIKRLENISSHAVHTIEEEPFIMSLDDGIAIKMAINALEQEPCEDAISRQEVLSYLCAHCPDNAECFDDCDDIKNIKALPSVRPQEPFNIDTYCKEHFCVMVDKDVWEKAEKALEQEPILDKIRAEIKQLPKYGAKFLNGYFTVHIDVDEALSIIDKYRGEA